MVQPRPETQGSLILGDVDQLPSVGPGQVLADVIASGAVPVVRLTEVFRQATESRTAGSAVARYALVLLRRAADSGSLKLKATQEECQLSCGFRLLHPSKRT